MILFVSGFEKDLHRKTGGGGGLKVIDDQLLLTQYERRRPKGPENDPFISTGALTAARSC
jgi:hypothetical protein